MIVFTIGTSEPFDRLVAVADAVAEACDEDVLVQGGHSTCSLQRAKMVPFLPYAELITAVDRASAIVTHAGVGSILLAVGRGRRPVVVPRLRRFGEAVDDHQLALGRKLDELGLVRLVDDPADLASMLASRGAETLTRSRETNGLALALRSHLAERLGPAGEELRTVA